MVKISSALSALISMAACSPFSNQARRRKKRLHSPSSDAARSVLCRLGPVETNTASHLCRNFDNAHGNL